MVPPQRGHQRYRSGVASVVLSSVRLTSVGGVPVRLHVSFLVGLIVASQFELRPFAWLALIIIVVVHEAGHAALLRVFSLPVIQVVLHGFGGECETVGWMTPWQRAVVAWGGVLAQGLLFWGVTLSASLGVWPGSTSDDLYSTLTATNLLIGCFNLLPFGTLDGREAWRLPWLGFLRARLAWLSWRLARLRAAATREERERLH